MNEICMIGPSLDGKGGITSVVHEYMDSDLFKKNKIYYIPTHIDKNSIDKLFLLIKAIIKTFLILLFTPVEIVHIHSSQLNSFYRKSIFVNISKMLNKKVILHMHAYDFIGFYNSVSPVKKKYIRYILKKTILIALSEQLKKDIGRITGAELDILELYNPININNFIKDKSEKICSLLFLGNLGKRKGIYDLINSCQLIEEDFILKIAGDGEIKKIKELILFKNLSHKIKVLGWVTGKEKENILKEADIFVLPSYNEGLPMSILEAMSYKIPIISTPVGGIPEAVIEGKTGYFVLPGDIKALANKMEKLIKDKTLREKIGNEAFELAKAKFNKNIIIQKLQRIYDSL